MENIYPLICRQADTMLERLRAVRRDLHIHPELGWCEVRTSSIVAERLAQLGYQVLTGADVCLAEARMGLPPEEDLERAYRRALARGAVQPYAQQARDGFTGVIGILDCGSGPTVAMRFDMDALGVYEEKGPDHFPSFAGFCSTDDGVMHACGHDGHVAIGLGVAELLAGLRTRLKGRIKLIFQPAEEGVRGARSIVEHGHLDDVDYVLGNHMGDNGGCGDQIGLTYGTTLATTKLDIFYTGRAAHAGASPEKGANAMLAAATAVLNLQAIPRSGAGDTRVNVGTLHAGSGRNVVCDRAKLEVEVRGSTTQVNQYMEDYARRIARAAGEMHGCGCEIRVVGAAESLGSHPDMVRCCEKVCREKLGLRPTPPGQSAEASEDYAYMVNRVHSHGGKGLFFKTLSPCAGPLHSKDFDFQEESLCSGVKVFCGLAYYLMCEERV